MNYRGYNIKIYTRSANPELYHYSQQFIRLDCPRVRLVRTTADGYFYQMIKDKDCDIAINIDEDAFLVNENAMMEMLDYAIDNNITNCAMADGTLLKIRLFNPIITNPFFNILNLKNIREKYNLRDIKSFDYVRHKKELIDKLPPVLAADERGLADSRKEPYYPFFFWLAYNFNTYYMPVEEHADGFSTVLKNQKGNPILLHSWWSRAYGVDEFHTNRINALMNEAAQASGITLNISKGDQRKIDFENKVTRKIYEGLRDGIEHFELWWNTQKQIQWIIRHVKKSPKHYWNVIKKKYV